MCFKPFVWLDGDYICVMSGMPLLIRTLKITLYFDVAFIRGIFTSGVLRSCMYTLTAGNLRDYRETRDLIIQGVVYNPKNEILHERSFNNYTETILY